MARIVSVHFRTVPRFAAVQASSFRQAACQLCRSYYAHSRRPHSAPVRVVELVSESRNSKRCHHVRRKRKAWVNGTRLTRKDQQRRRTLTVFPQRFPASERIPFKESARSLLPSFLVAAQHAAPVFPSLYRRVHLAIRRARGRPPVKRSPASASHENP
jgi:hypothetical protein